MFLKECVDSMPEDIMLFWAPGLYVPESEFENGVTHLEEIEYGHGIQNPIQLLLQWEDCIEHLKAM